MIRVFCFTSLLFLGGCATFTVPIYEDRVAEQEQCLKSSLCRFIINDRPAWTEKYTSDRSRCSAHSEEIAKQARADGLDVYFIVGDIGHERHSVAVVVGRDGERYAYDNGRISTQPFPIKELDHWMRNMVQTDKLHDAG